MPEYNLINFNMAQYFDGLGLSDKQLGKNVDIAMKNMAKWAKTIIAKDISQKTGISQRDLTRADKPKGRLFANKSKKYTHSGVVTLYPKPMNLMRFKARKTARGITSKVMSVSGAFIAKMPGASMAIVVKRRGKKRLPIDAVRFRIQGYFDSALKSVSSGGEIGKRYEYELNRLVRRVKFKRGMI